MSPSTIPLAPGGIQPLPENETVSLRTDTIGAKKITSINLSSYTGSRGRREHQVEPNSVTTVVKGGRRSDNISGSITGSYGTGHSRASSRIIATGRTTIVTVTIVYAPPLLEILS
ncbi:hypothetical protein EN45_039580 [Penicillium chrysogenum]|uniref:Uncharacterized protein n=1 Tax=Penicillium chrysogenum TaxID=5076 RepID=A0A167YAN3_PENCH|nr:hypothetical protein NUH16_004320 [Penicillium rubens]KAJ5859138.1 hypothetical protein N7534_004415 [Penicillium rubens]KZN93772.1 hypothetical protein EN45_039580 [Penicillium chrysogenum]